MDKINLTRRNRRQTRSDARFDATRRTCDFARWTYYTSEHKSRSMRRYTAMITAGCRKAMYYSLM